MSEKRDAVVEAVREDLGLMSKPRGSHSFFAVRRRTDQTNTLSQFVHLRAPPHE
jgi:hypothetical protein